MILVDYETVYNEKEGHSIKIQGTYWYLQDSRTDIYMVSVVGEGIEYCGPVEDFDWSQLHGKELSAHNARFDEAVFKRAQEKGQIPKDVVPARWYCTADLAAWSGCARNLAQASAILLGATVDKSIRKAMDGLTLEDARAQGLEEKLLAYCLNDSRYALSIWDKYNSTWPEKERLISEYNRMHGDRGFMVDQKALEAGLDSTKTALFNAEKLIPWDWSKAKTPNSPKSLAMYCRQHGIPAPVTTDKDAPECIEWLETYSAEHPCLSALHAWRQAYAMQGKLETIQKRIRPDGTIAVDELYFGAHTGRFSGVGGLNFLNLQKEEMVGVNIRNLFVARPGCILAIADQAQIEPRTLATVIGDYEFLKLCEKYSPYEVHARLYMGWEGGPLKEENPPMYALAKARVLALGYGAGWHKFITMAAMYITDARILADIFLKPVTKKDQSKFLEYLEATSSFTGKYSQFKAFPNLPEEQQRTWINSWLQVTDFRSKNPLITGFWKSLANDMTLSAESPDRTFEVELPNGRIKTYFQVSNLRRSLKAVDTRGRAPKHFYGGILCENLIQAIARDIFFEGYVELTQRGYHIPLHVYDENVFEIPKRGSKKKLNEITEVMRTRPDWFPDCPLDVEIKLSPCYVK